MVVAQAVEPALDVSRLLWTRWLLAERANSYRRNGGGARGRRTVRTRGQRLSRRSQVLVRHRAERHPPDGRVRLHLARARLVDESQRGVLICVAGRRRSVL